MVVEGSVLLAVLGLVMMWAGAVLLSSPVVLLAGVSLAYMAARVAGLVMSRRAMARESRALSGETAAALRRVEEGLARRGE